MKNQLYLLEQMSSTNSTVWIVGGGSPLSQAISKELESDYSIITFGRNSSCDRYIDLGDVQETDYTFRQCINELGVPKAIFFCQRFRPSASDKDLSDSTLLSKATFVEVYPLLAINSVLMSLDKKSLNVRMVVFSSTAALRGHNRTPRYYSVTKSIVAGLIPILTSEVMDIGCTWNCILLSEFFKGNGAHTLQRLKQLVGFAKKHVQGSIPRLHNIASFVRYLISDDGIYINGESIIFDGGYIKHGIDG